MITFEADARLAGKKIERAVSLAVPSVTGSLLFQLFRRRDVKVNGRRVPMGYLLREGDHVQVYIPDTPGKKAGEKSPGPDIVYEDENLLIVNKPQGLIVHPGKAEGEESLVGQARRRLGAEVLLCHRLDRNTGGLVILAKNRPALRAITEAMANGYVEKYYTCLVAGKMAVPKATLEAWLKKDASESHVSISMDPRPGWAPVVTAYRVLKTFPALPDSRPAASLLEVRLLTGKTHQIRAHLAALGHPVIGDGKYGKNVINHAFQARWQYLWATRLIFHFPDRSGILGYLGKDRLFFEVPPGFPV